MISVQRKLTKHLPRFKIIKDLIYFIDKDKFGNEQKRYIIPKNEIKLTIQEMHCKETAGHLGTDKTIEKIESRFFWISLNRDVRKFIKECHSCQKVKPPKNYCKPKLMPLAPTMTLIVITLDMAGPLPETPRGNRFMLAICDHFTKYTKTYAMKGQTAEEVAEKCVDFCLTYGIPEAILTDWYTNFTSQVSKAFGNDYM